MDDVTKEIFERITAVESSYKSLHKRVDKQEAIIDNIRDMVTEMKSMREDLNKMSEKVETLEEKPTKRWEALVGALIGAFAGGIGTFIVTKLTGG